MDPAEPADRSGRMSGGEIATPPRRPLRDMTTRELTRHQQQLDQALKDSPPGDPARVLLQQQFALVRAVVQARARPRSGESSVMAQSLPPGTHDLTTRIFLALFSDFDLHELGDGYVAVPKGTPLFSGTSLGELARQIGTVSSY